MDQKVMYVQSGDKKVKVEFWDATGDDRLAPATLSMLSHVNG
jgi:hypothetical protein